MVSRAVPGRRLGEFLPFPGPPGQFAEDGQGQGAVPAQQQLPGPGAEDLVEQARRRSIRGR